MLRYLEKYPSTIFWALVFLLIVSKLLTLVTFGFQYTGTDDLIYWHMAQDMSEFVFREPFFYGQAYNFPLEAYVAVPLIYLGFTPQFALPIAASFISLFPFLFFASVLFRSGRKMASFWILALVIGMAIEYDIITSISRGFTNGIFFSSFLIYPILFPSKKSSFLILGLSISLGFVANPNMLVFALPVAFYVFLENISNVKLYLYGVLGVIPALAFYYFAHQFYELNPDYISHKMWILTFSWEDFILAFTKLDTLFKYLTPFIWKGHWLILLFPFFSGFYLLKQDWRKGIALLFGVLFIIFSFGINKIHNDVGTIFYSSSRMFLALPLLVCFAIIWLSDTNKVSVRQLLIILSVSILIVGIKSFTIEEKVQFHTEKGYYGPVTVIKVDELREQVESIYSVIKDKEVDLVVCVSSDNYAPSEMALVTYGARFMVADFPETNLVHYERRTWNFIENKTIANKNIVVYNCLLGEMLDVSGMETEVLDLAPDMLLIKNNHKTVLELSKVFNYPYLRD
jgi:hypothetical protein